MSALLLMAAALTQEPADPSEAELRTGARLASARVIVTLEGIRETVAVSSDGRRVGVVLHDGGVRVVDAITGEIASPDADRRAEAVAVEDAAWLGLPSGEIVRIAPDGSERVFAVAAGGRIDGLVHASGRLAWSSTESDVGGVVDAATGEELARWSEVEPGAFSGWREPRVHLSPDGRWAAFRAPRAEGNGREVRVCDASTGALAASAKTYVAHAGPGFAIGNGFVLVGEREGREYRIVRLGLESTTRDVVDARARGKHFIDLHLSPGGRFLLEGDFEDDGVRIYDLEGGGEPRLLGGDGVTPLGFLALADGTELALTTTEQRTGLAAWSANAAARVAEAVPAVAGRRIAAAGSLRDGAGLWVRSSRSEEKRLVHAITLLSLD